MVMPRCLPAMQRIQTLIVGAVIVHLPIVSPAQSSVDARDRTAQIVVRIQHADYAGDREVLLRLHEELSKLKLPTQDVHLLSRVRYWQGFVFWRRAFNGFNDGTDRTMLERDLERAITHFEDATSLDPRFIDANVGQISCLQTLTFLKQADSVRAQALVSRFVRLLTESLVSQPENPRLLWVYGASQWWAPADLAKAQVIERQETAVATYKKGLVLARAQTGKVRDSIEPAWGEAELMMSLAWASLNRTNPDTHAAERFARQALTLVPHWHYVRDILLPQIIRAGRP